MSTGMDAITAAIIGALANLSTNAIKDSYEALKVALARKFGAKGDLPKAVESLEQKPDSAGRRETLKEEIANAKVDQDPEIAELARDLINKLSSLSPSSKETTVINQTAGDSAVQFGQVGGSVNLNQ
jgi:hypothetical protein